MKAGRLDQKITILRQTTTIGKAGNVTGPWNTLATVWADVTQVKASEFEAESEEGYLEQKKFTIRYLRGLTTKDRIFHNGATWDILGMTEIGRKEGLTLLCQTGDVQSAS